MTTLSPSAQELADWIAANLTAAQINALLNHFGLDLSALWAGSRQKTAEQIVGRLANSDQLNELAVYLGTIDETFTQRGPGTLSGSPLESAPPSRAARTVSTGFADPDNPGVPLRANRPLTTASEFFFWLEIGEPVAGAIDVTPTELDTSQLPADAELTVVLFGFENELELVPDQEIGRLKLQPDGSIRVAHSPTRPSLLPTDIDQNRLFFPVRTPAEPGIYRLRCHLYFRQLLLQSHLVTARVDREPRFGPETVLTTEIDYLLSRTLSESQLAAVEPHTLSIMLNTNGTDTHGFRFFGQDEFKNDVAIEAGALQNLISQARGALRKAAWGDEEPFDLDRSRYRYNGPLDAGRLKTDLLRLAIRGYRFYDALINDMAGGSRAAEAVADTMRRPGLVQLASKQSARLVVPLAMLYDHPLYTALNASEFSLCPTFSAALSAGDALVDCPCFQGECPAYGEDDVICPSGFWGFRHAIGHPITIQNGPEAPTALPAGSGLEIAMAVSTDPAFVGRIEHENAVRQSVPDLIFHYAAERPETIELLKNKSPHVFYFFCHGRIAADVPSIEVGPPGTRGISRDVLRVKRIRWEDGVRPLIFLNGCHTAALSPDKAFDLVTGFVDQAEAAGVIGSEITSFVPLARTFGESFFNHFLVEGRSVGEAVRRARLAVLAQGNPLGLIYIPFVVPSLKIS